MRSKRVGKKIKREKASGRKKRRHETKLSQRDIEKGGISAERKKQPHTPRVPGKRPSK